MAAVYMRGGCEVFYACRYTPEIRGYSGSGRFEWRFAFYGMAIEYEISYKSLHT